MNSSPPRHVPLLAALLLGVILLLAYLMASLPHWQYRYPLHIDEWMRYGDAQSLMESGRISYPNPFAAGEVMSPDIEVGFHLLLGAARDITGVSWLSLFRFLPGFMLMLLAFQVYALGRQRGFGLGAAFLVILIPTTVRYLGPAFLVPVALGLAFIPLTLYILHYLMSDLRGPVLLFLALFALLFIHPPTFAVVSAMTVIHLLFLLPDRSERRPAILAFVLMVPIYVFMPFWAPSFVSFITSAATDPRLHLALPPIQNAISTFGYIPAVLFAAGAGILAYQRGKCQLALLLTAVGLLAYQLIYPYFYLGFDIVYERGWLYTFVFMSILGGIALKELWQWVRKAPGTRQTLAATACYISISLLVLSSLAIGVRNHLKEPYYHVVDDVTYQDFLWVREHVPSRYRVGILETGQAWAFAAISGKTTYTAEVFPNYHARGRSVMAFLYNGAKDAGWLRERDISIVYTPQNVDNRQLIKVNNNTYLLIEEK